MAKKNPKVDEYLNSAKKWHDEMIKLRTIVLSCGLTEELKWNKPCYTFMDGNIIVLQGFKDSCAILITKGALINDPDNLLEKPGEHTQSARRVRFKNVKEIAALKDTLKAFILEALEIEKSGAKVEFKKPKEFIIPEELQVKLDKDTALNTAFFALTPGRQRAYLMHFSGAKQSKTRTSRVEKCIPQILDGIGLHDR